MEKNLKKGDIVQHFKREKMTEEQLKEEPNLYLYEIIGIAKHTENNKVSRRYSKISLIVFVFLRNYTTFWFSQITFINTFLDVLMKMYKIYTQEIY